MRHYGAYPLRFGQFGPAGLNGFGMGLTPSQGGGIPNPIPGIMGRYNGIWLAADDPVTLFTDSAGTTPVAADGDKVGLWRDKSGHSYHYSQATAGSRPTFKTAIVNGKPVIRSVGTPEVLTGTKLGITNAIGEISIFAVLTYGAATIDRMSVFFSRGNSNSITRAAIGLQNTGDLYSLSGRRLDTDAAQIVAGGIYDAGFHIQEGNIVWGSSDAFLYLDGSLTASSTTFQTDGVTGASNELASSILGGAGLFQAGDMAEVIVVVGDLSVADRSAIYGYLSGKYSITVPLGLSGSWTWFNDPRAIEVGGQIVLGSVSMGGDIITSGADFTPVILKSALQQDDHDNPSFLRRASDGRLLAFYSGHAVTETYMQISTNPDDASAWGAPIGLDAQFGADTYSYTNPLQLLGEDGDPIYLFLRCATGGGNPALHFSKSMDGGTTWDAVTKVLNGNRPYFRVVCNGDARIDVCCNDGHPTDVATNSVYHLYYEAGVWHKSDGTPLVAPPYTPSTALTKVFDGSTAAGQAWVWDISIDATGRPVIVYACFPTDTDHRYRYARWTGSAWGDHEICVAGGPLYAVETFYSGGVRIDPDNVNIVYCSREINGVFQLFRYTTADAGATWSGEQLTSGVVDCFRPFKVGNKLAYVTGEYTAFTQYATVVALRDI